MKNTVKSDIDSIDSVDKRPPSTNCKFQLDDVKSKNEIVQLLKTKFRKKSFFQNFEFGMNTCSWFLCQKYLKTQNLSKKIASLKN